MNEALIARDGVPVELDRQRIVFFDKTASFQLLEKYGDGYLGELYGAGKTPDGKPTVKLKNVDVLEYFLWAGLQEDARLAGEQLHLEQVSGWFMPSTTMRIFDAVIVAITRDIHTPPLPGKALAATASPAAAAKKRASTSRKRSASRSRSSSKPRKSSGPRR